MKRLWQGIRAWFRNIFGAKTLKHSPQSWAKIRDKYVNSKEHIDHMVSEVNKGTSVNLRVPSSWYQSKQRDLFVNLLVADIYIKCSARKNRHEKIDEYNAIVGNQLWTPYACAAIMVNFDLFCRASGLSNPLELFRTADNLANIVPKKFLKFSNARKGDLVIFNAGLQGYIPYHIGVLTEDQQKDSLRFSTIEYNVDAGGALNGNGVHLVQRYTDAMSMAKFKCFIDVVGWALEASGKAY